MAQRKTSSQKKILKEIDEIKRKEDELIGTVQKDIQKDTERKAKVAKLVEHFSFNDFAQIMIGVCVWGLPAFINDSFWNYLPVVDTAFLIAIHTFFMLCVFLALNYEFRESFTLKSFWFTKMLLKRFFYTYFSVMMIVVLLLLLVDQINYGFTNLLVFRNFIASQSVGMFGAVTFTFLKK